MEVNPDRSLINLMNIALFDFDLPVGLIAQTPIQNRSESRLMVLETESQAIRHCNFYQILDYVEAGDCLVLNDTKVLPARLYGVKEETGGKIEVLLLKEDGKDSWEALVKPGKKVKIGTKLTFGEGLLQAECVGHTDYGGRVFHFTYEGIFYEVLDQLGEMPLPPYITEQLEDKSRYQTVFAKNEGSAAAPTAGLHFTEELLEKAQAKGVHLAFITLHVGLGTFRPVQVEDINDHQMHSEFYQLTEGTARLLNQVKGKGGKIISVGTTSTRTIETVAQKYNGHFQADKGWTDIFIYPGYDFKGIDGMITNFHLPKSTLIMLTSALAGNDFVMKAYEEAVKEKYRFFSFGDAMLIR